MSQHASPEVAEVAEVRVWDRLLRGFHWALVLLVTAAIASGLAGGDWMVWHARAGQAIAALLALRLSWGLWGSRYARFTQFWPRPSRVVAYLRGRWHGLGHNPLGALSVLAVLGLLAFQVGSGLVGNDEIAFTGPWAGAIDEELSLKLTSWHRLTAKFLYAWIALHLLAILLHTVVKRHSLLRAMLTGRTRGSPADAATPVPAWRGLLSLVIAAAAAALAAVPQLIAH